MDYKSRKMTLLLFITVLFLITSFVVNASAQNIWFTNIWYKKLPNYTHLTIKASGAISEYEVSYLETPERIIIDVKNANYSIDGLVKNILFLNMGSVKQVRCGQFESEPIPITRFIVDLFKAADYEVKLSSDSRLLYIDVYDYTEFKAPEEQVFTVIPVKSEAVKIEKEEAPKISILDIYTDPINLNIFEEDVVNVIRGLSELTGIDVIFDDSVTGKLTLNFKDKTFREAIELLMINKGLDYTEVSNTLIIAAKDVVAGYKKPITRVYELKNATAEGAKVILDGYKAEGSKVNIVADARMNTLIVTGTNEEIEKVEGIISTIDEELLTRTFKIDNAIDEEDIKAIQNMLSIIIPDVENRVKIDNRQNEIIVKGTKEELKNAEELIPKLDKRATQMTFEIKFIEIDLIGEKEMGIKWTSGGIEGEISIGEITLGGSLERSGLIEAKLLALQTENKINILSNPKIHAINGKEAFIFSGKQIPILTKDPETGEDMVTGRENVGIRMSIIPWVSADGVINMVVRADKSYLGQEVKPGIFIIESQQIAYKGKGEGPAMIIRAYPDETIVLGGLIESTESENVYKIPLLGDIPIIGELFKRTTKIKTRTQIVILITAHLLDY
ncbi:secretin and TonB N-terminal domain-containing protein [bacterium]|nr:secretin and TonB N-terminal domain-containing protein [bacterium]